MKNIPCTLLCVISLIGWTHATGSTSNSPPSEQETSFAFLLLLALELFCFFTAYTLKQSHFKYLQEAGAYILFGAIVGGFVRFVSSLQRLKDIVSFDSEVFFLILLPPIIFESGYNMKRRAFFKNIDGIILFAFVGTTVATFVTGFLLYGVAYLGWTSTPLSILECFLFGSLISATDPVSVLAVFKELKVHIDLYSIIFGESVLNDAVAIVLYKYVLFAWHDLQERTVLNFANHPFNGTTIVMATLSFCYIFIGSTLIGVFIGLLSSLWFKYFEFHKYTILETAVLILFAYSSYLLADGLSLSGIVAILFCGIVMAHYTYKNLAEESQKLTSDFFQTVALLSETLIFMYLGLAVFSFDNSFDFGFIILGLIVIFIARAAHVFPLSWVMNRWRPSEDKVAGRYQLFACFAGLRGGMAFSLALDLTTSEKAQLLSEGSRLSIYTTTLVIAFFPVLALGGTTIPLLEYLSIPMGVENPPTSLKGKPAKGFLLFDRQHIKPLLTKLPPDYREQTDDLDSIEMTSV